MERTSIEELAPRGGIAAGHVVLDGGGDGTSDQQRSTVVRQSIELKNPTNGKLDGDAAVRLRAEVREHYRLARTGIIEKSACEQATRSILGDFQTERDCTCGPSPRRTQNISVR